jgi:hypothetical protein
MAKKYKPQGTMQYTVIFYLCGVVYKRIICFILAGMFLTGSVIFPLGDISLMRDIPKMYQNYTKVTFEEEVGVIDFIGDYLLHGKQLFGHNEHDKVPAKGNEVRFQHRASPPNMVFARLLKVSFIEPFAIIPHPQFNIQFYNSDYRNKLFRPPLS